MLFRRNGVCWNGNRVRGLAGFIAREKSAAAASRRAKNVLRDWKCSPVSNLHSVCVCQYKYLEFSGPNTTVFTSPKLLTCHTRVPPRRLGDSFGAFHSAKPDKPNISPTNERYAHEPRDPIRESSKASQPAQSRFTSRTRRLFVPHKTHNTP